MIAHLKSRIRQYLLNRWGLTESLSLLSSEQFRQQRQFGRTSFAQEGEDILFKRILTTTSPPGTYIDVGGNHPFHMSNTASLYQAGWSGIVIDPNPKYTPLYAELRPRDIFVNCGIAETESQLNYYQFEEPLFNTFDPQSADRASAHSKLQRQDSVLVQPLAKVLNKTWPDGKRINLLSIDCEGLDAQIIRSHDFNKFPTEFVFAELEETSLSSAEACVEYQLLEERGYIAVSKLWKSALFAHHTTVESRGLQI